MNARERFLSVMNFEPCDRTMFWEFGYWKDTVRRWYEEGLPKTDKENLPKRSKRMDFSVVSMELNNSVCGEAISWAREVDASAPRDTDIHNYFGFDKGMMNIFINSFLFPPFETKILKDEGDNVVIIDGWGITQRARKDGNSTPQYLGWPVQNRNDWERLKEEKFQVDIEKRLPENWLQLMKQDRKEGYVLCCGYSISFFGLLRVLLGEVNLFTKYYDDPRLIKDILAFLCEFWIDLWSQIFTQVKADFAIIGEDIAYKNGSLISPAIFREFMLPHYKRITSFLRNSGINIIIVDTDGDFRELIPLFLEGGITGFSPCEVQAGVDIVKVRQKYPKLQILGGLDKIKIAAGRKEIDQELESKLPFMLQQGGYVPHIDHIVPPDVPWENFKYYRERVREMVYEYGSCKKKKRFNIS